MSPFISCYCFQLSSCLTPGLPWKMRVDFWQLAVLFIFFDQFCNWPTKLSLKFPLRLSNISCNIKDNTLHGGRVQPRATAIQASSPCFSFLQGCSAAEGEEWRAVGGWAWGRLPFLRSCPSCVMAALGFHVLSGWVSCSSSLCFLAENRCPSEAGDTPSSASISAQLSVAGLGSHLADTSSSADTFPPAWAQLADRQLSVQIKQSRTLYSESPSLLTAVTPLLLTPLLVTFL